MFTLLSSTVGYLKKKWCFRGAGEQDFLVLASGETTNHKSVFLGMGANRSKNDTGTQGKWSKRSINY